MKITGGKHRGRRLETPPPACAEPKRPRFGVGRAGSLRPTTGFLREVMFNLLLHGRFLGEEEFVSDGEHLIEGRRVVDVCCGTGALALEALSRGAAHATLIDNNPAFLALARRNIEMLGEGVNTTLIRADAASLLPAATPCMLAFLDPPYRKGIALPALSGLAAQGWLARGAVVVWEHDSREVLVTPASYRLLDSREHDQKAVTLFQFLGP